MKPEYQRLIADAGDLSRLVSLLKRRANGSNKCVVNGVLRRAADAIINLAHENGTINSFRGATTFPYCFLMSRLQITVH